MAYRKRTVSNSVPSNDGGAGSPVHDQPSSDPEVTQDVPVEKASGKRVSIKEMHLMLSAHFDQHDFTDWRTNSIAMPINEARREVKLFRCVDGAHVGAIFVLPEDFPMPQRLIT